MCAEVSSAAVGTSIALSSCNGEPAQSFQFSENGTISPTSAPDMCLTVAESTRTGRSDVNQIKVLSLESCQDDSAKYQTWATRSSL